MYVPLGWFARTATEDVKVGNVVDKKGEGERVLSMYAGASRDPSVYEYPDRFLVDRRFCRNSAMRPKHCCEGDTDQKASE